MAPWNITVITFTPLNHVGMHVLAALALVFVCIAVQVPSTSHPS